MTRDEILQLLRSTMTELFQLDEGAIVPKARLVEDLDLDSIDAIDLAVRMQDQLGVKVDEATLRNVRTVDDVIDLVQGMLRTRDGGQPA